MNNSAEDVQVLSDGQSYAARKNVVTEIRWPGNTLTLQINTGGGKSWKYLVRPVPANFRQREKIYMQLEPDGTVYGLLAAPTSPVTSFPQQPTGMPWRPLHN